jgi:uncharacterized membrane protein
MDVPVDRTAAAGDPARRTRPPAGGMPPHVTRNIEEIVRIEGRDRLSITRSDRFADFMTKFGGSMVFVWLHVAWFGVWILLNEIGVLTFDQFPFGFLTMIVSLEAIFLSAFVLISENRQAQQSDRRAKVDLQINLIAEQEITKIISLVAEIHDHLGLRRKRDQELDHMQDQTNVERIANALDGVEADEGPAAAIPVR